MARIASVTLPSAKRIDAALPYIFGIGRTKAKEILKTTGVAPEIRVKDLTETQVDTLSNYINQNFKVEGDLRREILGNIKRLKEIKSYRGTRHAKNLPARGQRTKTNSRTVRGNKRSTMGSGKKPKGMLK
jgi:small subunit ribosomal protein S13